MVIDVLDFLFMLWPVLGHSMINFWSMDIYQLTLTRLGRYIRTVCSLYLFSIFKGNIEYNKVNFELCLGRLTGDYTFKLV